MPNIVWELLAQFSLVKEIAKSAYHLCMYL